MAAKLPDPEYTVAAVAALGVLLAFASALVPFFSAGYQLDVAVLLAGLVPYLVYAVSAPGLSRALALGVGLVLLAVHGWLVISERFLGGADDSTGLIVFVPLVLGALLTPLLVLVARKPY